MGFGSFQVGNPPLTANVFCVHNGRVKKGFTLIELMVVIAILAVIGLISISLYGNAQKTARDGRRRSDIDQMAKSIESARDFTSKDSPYTYKTDQYNEDYANSLPTDPSPSKNYCYKSANDAKILDPSLTWDTGCPVGWLAFDSNVNIDKVRYWKVCASLENTSVVYCKASLLK